MRIERLELENFRGFEKLDLRFAPGINLLVGVNGSGKSSVLDAISGSLAQGWKGKLQKFIALRSSVTGASSNVKIGTATFSIRCDFHLSSGSEGSISSSGSVSGSVMTTKLEVSSRSFRGPPPEVTLKFCAGRTSRFRTQLRHPAEVPPRSLDDEDYFDPRLMALEDSLDGIETDLHDFMKWYAEAEAIENIERLGEAGVGWRDPILDGVRSAIISLDSRWTSLKYDRKKRTLIVAKSGTELSLSSLSDGEKSLIALAGEIGWRLAVGCGDPKTAEAVVLLDEVELHLHPSLQRVVLPRLQAAFPKVQFIATTHSPQVVASVPSDRVHVLRDFQVVAPSGGTYGRDSNSLLEDVFGTDSRPTETRDKLDAIARAIDAESFDEARKLVAELQSTLGAQDRELNRLESMVEYLDTGT